MATSKLRIILREHIEGGGGELTKKWVDGGSQRRDE